MDEEQGRSSKQKYCPDCDSEKPVADFHRNKSRPDGLASSCKPCCITRTARWRKENPEQYKACYYKNSRKYKLKNKYGLAIEDYDNLLQLQSDACRICKKLSTESKRDLAVDHCNRTGRVRGLLCGNCNLGIGLFRDNPEFLQAAIEYLTEAENAISRRK